ATEMIHRCLGQQRGVPWLHVPSQEGENQLAEEQPCGKQEKSQLCQENGCGYDGLTTSLC
ncbi:unnamed protein product, partial [Bubo scandiacus]